MRHSAVGWPRIDSGGSAKILVGIRLEKELIDAIDDWILREGEAITRQEAIRRMIVRQLG